MRSVILRTLCGCERIVKVPREYPPYWAVAMRRTNSSHMYADEQGTGAFSNFQTRRFERTGIRGVYGYEVYLEMNTQEKP